MSWTVAVAGTVHVDDITTPEGRREELLGGSAVYFALAAARHAPVRLCGIVGADAADRFTPVLEAAGVDWSGLVVSPNPTFRWRARHDFERWEAVDTSSDDGCDPEWAPVLDAATRDAPVLFLGSMRPALQSQALLQSRSRLIGADSMVDYTGPRAHEVGAVARASDIVFLNRHELASLTGLHADDWQRAARSLCGEGRLRALVVKAGPLGAAVVTANATVERPAAAVARVVDPTGAGDALAGGFLGLCAAAERDDEAHFADALDAGLSCAAAAISAFGIDGLVR